MLLPKTDDAVHLSWMYRLLQALADDIFLSSTLRFKGGTCAAMRGFIERFSVDLDFDIPGDAPLQKIREHLEKIFHKTGVKIADQSQNVPQYFLKYPAPANKRNSLRLDLNNLIPQGNQYEAVRFPEIDRIFTCQTLPTMVANKLIALGSRYEKKEILAGRDVFDLHTFFFQGYRYERSIVEKRTGKSVEQVLEESIELIETQLTETIIDQDLNHLLPVDRFHQIRKILKQETLMLLRRELERVKRGE